MSNQSQNDVKSGKMKTSQLTKISKKGQEEIMGFMLILVLIVVIGMFFMFMLKPRVTQSQQSVQVENLLSSIKHVNSACDKEMQEVVIMCSRDEMCGEQDACSYLKGEIKTIIDTATEKAGMGAVMGYNLTIASLNFEIFEGNKTETSMAAISPLQGDMSMQLTFYYP